MSWISGFFHKKNPQVCQPLTPVEQNPNSTPNPNTMLQVVVEETVMTAAKWLISFINRSLEVKPVSPVAPVVETQTADAKANSASSVDTSDTVCNSSNSYQTNSIEEVLNKFACLLEKSHNHIQVTTTLENRIRAIENLLKRNSHLEQQFKTLTQSLISLEQRLAQLEDSVGQVDIAAIQKFSEVEQHLENIEAATRLTANFEARLLNLENFVVNENSARDQIVKVDQNLNVLEKRVDSLEKLIARLSLMRRYIENNYRSIASLQNHVRSLGSASASNGNGSHN
jgi:DNA repair exonuclease SbcCD ATPase subunit